MATAPDSDRLPALEEDADLPGDDASAGASPAGTRCPHCGSEDVRVSHRHASHAGHVTYRCRTCKRHFRVAAAKDHKKLLTGLAVAGAVLVAVVFGLLDPDDPPAGASGAGHISADDQERLKNFEVAAKRGDLEAQSELGRIRWQRAEYPEALPWLYAAAGREHAEAEYLLGMAHLQGRGTVQNYRAALEQFTKAAEHGQLDAQYQLGIFHRDGLATTASKETAYLWFNLAAARGHADALVMRDRLAAVMNGEELLRAQASSEEALRRFVKSAVAPAEAAPAQADAPAQTTPAQTTPAQAKPAQASSAQ